MSEPATTLLIVEDDRDVRELAVAVLETEGFRVLEAASGDEAYRLLTSHPDLWVDVLFTDIVMPGRLDGIDLARALQRLRPGLQVLYTSGFADLVRRHDPDDMLGPMLRKPYRPAELRRVLAGLTDALDRPAPHGKLT